MRVRGFSLARLRDDDQGAVLAIVAISLLVLLGMLVLTFDLGHGVALKADAHNLLDAPYEYTQGSVVRDTWTVGRSIGVGISWGGGI